MADATLNICQAGWTTNRKRWGRLPLQLNSHRTALTTVNYFTFICIKQSRFSPMKLIKTPDIYQNYYSGMNCKPYFCTFDDP
jgi:hypothetical protein